MTFHHRMSVCCALAIIGAVGCGDLTGAAELPAGTKSPNAYNTSAGALGMHRGTKISVVDAARFFTVLSGAFTDELRAPKLGSGPASIGAEGSLLDSRTTGQDLNRNVGFPLLYSALHRVRADAGQTIGLLTMYAPELSSALRGEMYALQGYAEILLAEMYCSGIPLSTLDFEGDLTYRPASTQVQVYQHAVALFDSALAISSDSASVVRLASVLKGRALMNMGHYAEAAQAVASVPTEFQYTIPMNFSANIGSGTSNPYAFLRSGQVVSSVATDYNWNVSAAEGVNGLPFTSGDPRSRVTAVGTNSFGVQWFQPSKYPHATEVAFVIANGVEARLIEAEANLRSGGTQWLSILNTLRTTCLSAGSCPTPAPAGTGAVAGLPPLTDPGTENGRIDLVFSERAFWLFLTGHRQGDLRRLVRPVDEGGYGRDQSVVYPTGSYYGGFGSYGRELNLPIPDAELVNPLFHGCLDRGA